MNRGIECHRDIRTLRTPRNDSAPIREWGPFLGTVCTLVIHDTSLTGKPIFLLLTNITVGVGGAISFILEKLRWHYDVLARKATRLTVVRSRCHEVSIVVLQSIFDANIGIHVRGSKNTLDWLSCPWNSHFEQLTCESVWSFRWHWSMIVVKGCRLSQSKLFCL